MKFDYAETRAVIRIRSLDIKGLVNETYELPRSSDWEGLGRKGVEFSKRFTWDNVARAEWRALEGDNERRVTRTRRKACNF